MLLNHMRVMLDISSNLGMVILMIADVTNVMTNAFCINFYQLQVAS